MMSVMKMTKHHHRQQRKRRIRARVSGTAERPRMSVFRSHLHLSVQLIDDTAGRTLVAASTRDCKAKANMEGARSLGALVAKKAAEANVTAVVFDRNGYAYHGMVKQLADAAREGGLRF